MRIAPTLLLDIVTKLSDEKRSDSVDGVRRCEGHLEGVDRYVKRGLPGRRREERQMSRILESSRSII